jgi:hypothetical protein
MLNIIAMVAVIAAILLSKNRFIPVTILAYYCAYFCLEAGLFGWIDDTGIVSETSFNLATIYYISFAAIELLIIIALCINTNKHKKVGIIYAFVVLTSMVYNSIQAVSMSIESNWFVNFYTIRQQIAIPLDIVFAIIGSDNFVSRKLNNYLNLWRDNINADSRSRSN